MLPQIVWLVHESYSWIVLQDTLSVLTICSRSCSGVFWHPIRSAAISICFLITILNIYWFVVEALFPFFQYFFAISQFGYSFLFQEHCNFPSSSRLWIHIRQRSRSSVLRHLSVIKFFKIAEQLCFVGYCLSDSSSTNLHALLWSDSICHLWLSATVGTVSISTSDCLPYPFRFFSVSQFGCC